MARKKTVKSKKRSKNTSSLFLKNLPLLGILVLFLLLFSSVSFLSSKLQVKNSYISAPKIAKETPKASRSAKLVNASTKPSPTTLEYSAGIPTTQPSSGYCLYVPVLVYHHIQPEATARQLGQTSLTVDNGIFAQQMEYLATHGYNAIWASDLVNALRNHTGLPPKSILITMDDGYADNDIYALPVLKQYGLKANLMLASGLVGSNPDMLTWSQVADMKNSGLYYFTDHTWSHYAISNGPQSKIQFEITTAQNEIQQHTGQTVNIFTYPYGSFNSNAINTLTSDGFIGGFSTIPGMYQCDSFIMTLHRTHIGNAPLSAYGL